MSCMSSSRHAKRTYSTTGPTAAGFDLRGPKILLASHHLTGTILLMLTVHIERQSIHGKRLAHRRIRFCVPCITRVPGHDRQDVVAASIKIFAKANEADAHLSLDFLLVLPYGAYFRLRMATDLHMQEPRKNGRFGAWRQSSSLAAKRNREQQGKQKRRLDIVDHIRAAV